MKPRTWSSNRSAQSLIPLKEIDVAPGLLGRWVKNERERRGSSDGLSQTDLRAENARLRRELAEAKMDNEFLSQATAFFVLKQREKKSSN